MRAFLKLVGLPNKKKITNVCNEHGYCFLSPALAGLFQCSDPTLYKSLLTNQPF